MIKIEKRGSGFYCSGNRISYFDSLKPPRKSPLSFSGNSIVANVLPENGLGSRKKKKKKS